MVYIHKTRIRLISNQSEVIHIYTEFIPLLKDFLSSARFTTISKENYGFSSMNFSGTEVKGSFVEYLDGSYFNPYQADIFGSYT
jgi:hypothetical protein